MTPPNIKEAGFVEMWVFARPSVSTPWFKESSPVNRALNNEYREAEEAASGYMGRAEMKFPDNLRYGVYLFWRSQEERDAFVAANERMVDRFLTARAQYYAVNGIVTMTTYGS